MSKNKETGKIPQPHDRGYKRSLSQPGEFLHFLKKYVRAEWMLNLEESQLSLCDKEFVTKDYEGREADLVYRIQTSSSQEIYIFVLQELQSTVDYTMIFRLWFPLFSITGNPTGQPSGRSGITKEAELCLAAMC